MNNRKVTLFYELCRLCLEKPGAEDMFEKSDLIDDIFLCTGVHITRSDNLPQKICVECLEVVTKSKHLRVLATENDKHLKSLFDDNGEINLIEGGKENSGETTDSDQTVIIDNINLVASNVKEVKKSKKRSSSSCKSEQSNPQMKKIFVRKDLFDSSMAVTSSTKDTSIKVTKAKSEHLKTKGDLSKEYECEVCQKKFTVWKKFYLHQRSHNKNIICPLDMCGKKFATKGDLEKHIRSHTGDRPYRCEICNRSFTQRGTLKVHRETVHADVGSQEYII